MTALDEAFEAWRRRALDADILKIAESGFVKAKLKKKSREHVGACPMCGGGSNVKGKQRAPDGFAVNSKKRVFNCRKAGTGGDVIAMVMHTLGVPFLAACEMITGEPPPARGSVISEETKKKSEELKAEADERERRRIEDDNIYRQREIRTCRDIHDRAHPFTGSSAEIYAGIRGLTFPRAPEGRNAAIKCVEAMPYHVDKETIVHRGPAMTASIVNSKRKFQGLHFTYLDLERDKGKLQLDYKGEPLDPKKSRGSKQGNFVPICGPAEPQLLVIGEAIEKTIAVWMALESTGRDLSSASFWSACDLGNLAGRSSGSVTHPTLKSEKTGKPIKVGGGSPDLTSASIEIPDSVTDLVLLGDSTSDPFSTRLAMARAAVRYSVPGRTVRIAWAPEGVDFDDLLRAARGDQEATAAALARIAGIVDAATPDALEPIEPPADDVDPAILAQAIRKFGLEELNAGLARIRSSEGDDRGPVFDGIAEQLGQMVGAGAIEEPFAKAALEGAALDCGLIGAIGIKAVQRAITTGLKAGKKHPRDFSHVRREATALSRPRPAAVLLNLPSDQGASALSADPRDSTSLSSIFSVSSSSPRSPSPEEEGQPQTLAKDEENADDDGDDIPPDETVSDETFRECAALDQSDVDNGQRLIAYFGRDLMVRQEDDVPAGQMLAWTGTHWDLAGGEALAHLIGQKVGDLIKLEAAYIEFSDSEARTVNNAEAAARELKALNPDSDSAEERARVEQLVEQVAAGKKARTALSTRRANRKKWGIATKNGGRISQMLKCAAPHLRKHPDAFNADPLKVATLTHTLTFVPIEDPENPDPDGKRSLVIDGRVQYQLVAKRGHDRADMLTAVIPYAYNRKASCRDFNVFLDLFQPEATKRRTVQQYSGMSLTAQPVQRVMFHTGTGGNGKSVFLEVLARVFGDGLSVGLPAESVSGQVQNNPSAPTPDIARCYAKRYLRVAELPKDAPLKAETIKKLTGGERWPVRTMYKGYFEFKPTAKPHMSGNGEPKFDGADGGMRRRLVIVEWSVKLAEALHRDFEEVVSEIVAGGSGILNWLIEGALDFLNNGFIMSEDVLQTTAEHFAEMDPVGQFADAHVKADVGGPGVQSRAMFHAYVAWSEVNGKSHKRETGFALVMKKKFKRDDTGRVHRYVDVALHDVPDNPANSHPQSSTATPPNDGYQPPDRYPGDELM
jgi:putative DNA primase/helicase